MTTTPAKKAFNWRLFWLLGGLNLAGALAIIPFSLSLATSNPALQNTDIPLSQITAGIVIVQVISALIYGLLIAAGLLLAAPIGLGAPFLAGWLANNPTRARFKAALKPAIIIGVALPIFNQFILILTRLLENKPTGFGFFPGSTTIAPRWQLFLSAISAGITEETLFRLFLFSLFAWLGSRVIRSQRAQPKKAVFWIANILSALLFGLYHLSTARLDDPASVMRSIGMNSLGGLAFGWLYGSYGLESAMIAHTLADILFYIVAPYFISF